MSTYSQSIKDVDIAKQLGMAIRGKRKELGVRIDVAADMIGISKNTLSDIENGVHGVSIGKIMLVAKELGVKFMLEVVK